VRHAPAPLCYCNILRMYNLIVQLILCLSFFALGSQHSAQRVFGAGTVALHLLSGASVLLLCFALLGVMILLGLVLLLAKYSAVYFGSLVREFSVWRSGNGAGGARDD
jgi:hypothetical protein